MLIYNELKNKPREFLAATGLKLNEFEKLRPAFQTAYEQKYPPELTPAGTIRQRQIGGGATGALPKIEDQLFFILVSQQTHPLQTMHGLQFGVSQPQAHDWIPRLLPVLQHALRDLGEAPERDARRVATSDLARAGGPDLTLDGSERRLSACFRDASTGGAAPTKLYAQAMQLLKQRGRTGSSFSHTPRQSKPGVWLVPYRSAAPPGL